MSAGPPVTLAGRVVRLRAGLADQPWCWSTPTKPGRPAAGLGLLREVATSGAVHRPWFAIGGIDADRLDAVCAAGARRVVVVRAITAADDPQAAASGLARRLAADRPPMAQR